MGSFRGRLIFLFFILLPTTALSEVCDKARALWSRGDGPASALDELIALSSLPVTLVLVAVSAVALIMRVRLMFALVAVLWACLTLIITTGAYGPVLDDVRHFAIKEGCIGSPHLFIALAIAICAGMVYGALRPRN